MFCPNLGCIDYVQDRIHGEYVDGITVCPRCGAALVAELPKDEPLLTARPGTAPDPADLALEIGEPAPPPAGVLVALAAFDYPDEVEPVVALLAANGITAYSFLDDGRDFDDAGGASPCTRVLVPQSQFQAATMLVERLEQEARARL